MKFSEMDRPIKGLFYRKIAKPLNKCTERLKCAAFYLIDTYFSYLTY
jgi:hypothetical protein